MSNKFSAVIIDDESLARELIKKYLSHHDKITVAAECSNGFEAVKCINELKPDLIFLDIQMPRINGFEMLELIDQPPVIIFTTAYDNYALKAFEVNAVDYLLKPFSQERFDEAISRAFLYLDNKFSQHDKIKGLLETADKNIEYLDRVVFKDGTNVTIIPIEEIRYLEAQDDYVMFYTSQKKFLKNKTMKYFEEHLNPKDFIRIHRSYIAALKEIKKIELIEKNSYQIVLDDCKTLPLSRSGYNKLKDILR